MSLNNAFSDGTFFGVAAVGADNFLICQKGGGYVGKDNPEALVYYEWSGQNVVNDNLGGGNLTSAPGVTKSRNFAARWTDGNIRYKQNVNGQWKSLPGGALTSAPAICEEGGSLHIFARGLDNQLWHTFKTSTADWIGWRRQEEGIPDLPGGMNLLRP